jgi:putative Holliday junction resolvase
MMGIDPGDKRLGIAISDETGTIANPHLVIPHISRAENARRIVEIANVNAVICIVIGQTLTDEGEVSFQGRKSQRLKDAIHQISQIPIIFWNEDFSTNLAQESRRAMGIKTKNHQSHFDAIAATIILQGYLDSIHHNSLPDSVKENS